MSNKKKIILFGAGVVGRRALNFYGSERVYCFADNYKSGQKYFGKDVISFEELKQIHHDYDVILSVYYVCAKSLKAQCASHGISAPVWGDIVTYMDYESDPKIAKYKNRHKGQRCFLIGNGPSLQMKDLNILHEHAEISFGCNQVNRLYGQTNWRPNYYFSGGIAMFSGCMNDLLQACVGVNFSPYLEGDYIRDVTEYLKKIESIKGEMNFFNCLSVSDDKKPVFFSPDPSRASQAGPSVMYHMMQFAAYMGFKEIYTLGLDCTNALGRNFERHFSDKEHFSGKRYSSDKEHFYEDEPENDCSFKDERIIADRPTYLDLSFNCYKSASAYMKAHDIAIYNATRGGLLEEFERVDFDALF